MADKILSRYDTQVSIQTVKNQLDGVHKQPQYINTEQNKEKRRAFLVRLNELKAPGKKVFYMDKTNFNLWTSRSKGWSRVGQRAVKTEKAGGGQNMQVLACIGIDGLAAYETFFGRNNSENVNFLFQDCYEDCKKTTLSMMLCW
ncbi:hypothetical protein AC1031_013778 [Aphanomyces cochlioides]|nr:hypothetical protein AC1031_013778 [Aphanomyces cochlioides]